MSSINPETLSAFGRQAVKLDADFTELARLSGQIQRLDLDTESGLELAVKLLDQFSRHGMGISDGIQKFSKVLMEANQQSEAAAKLVADRAQLIRQRKELQNQIREKLNQVEQNVAAASTRLGGLRKEGNVEFSNDEKFQIKAEFERLNVELKNFMAEAQAVKEEATQARFKSIERDAQTLLDALRSSCRKVEKVIAG